MYVKAGTVEMESVHSYTSSINSKTTRCNRAPVFTTLPWLRIFFAYYALFCHLIARVNFSSK